MASRFSEVKRFFRKNAVDRESAQAAETAITILDNNGLDDVVKKLGNYRPGSTDSKQLLEKLGIHSDMPSVEGVLLATAGTIGAYSIMLGGAGADSPAVYTDYDESSRVKRPQITPDSIRHALITYLQNPANYDKGLCKRICDIVLKDEGPALATRWSLQ